MDIDSVYSSDDNYYLNEEKEHINLSQGFNYFLHRYSELHNIHLGSNPEDIANFLKEMNAKHGHNIRVDPEFIKKKLVKSEQRRKKLEKFFDQKERNKGKGKGITEEENNSKKKQSSLPKCLFEGSPSSVLPKNTNPNQEAATPSTSHIPATVLVNNGDVPAVQSCGGDSVLVFKK